MDRKKIKCILTGFILVTAAGALLRHPDPVAAATENDLRYVTGVGRLSEKAIQKKIDKFSDRLALDNTYNEMVAYVKANGLSTNITEKRVENEKKAYESLMSDFDSGKSASAVKEALSKYNSYAQPDYESVGTDTAMDYTDTTKVKAKIASLKELSVIAKDRTDIGGVSNKAPRVAGKVLRIYSLGRGKTGFFTDKKEKIYCVFSGLIIKMTDKSVTVRSGKTIEITYSGIRPAEGLKTGQKVMQKTLIGRSRGTHITVLSKMGGKDFDFVTALGQKGKTAYNEYIAENPWSEYAVDINKMICTNSYGSGIKKKKKEKKNVIGYYYENGKKKSLAMQESTSSGDKNTKKTGGSNLFHGDPFDEDSGSDVSAERSSN